MFHSYETQNKIKCDIIAGFSATSLALRVIFVRLKRPPIYASCMTISGGRTEQLDIIAGFSATSLALQVIFIRRKRPPIYASCMTISGERTKQHVIIGFWRAGCSRLEYVDSHSVY